MKGETFIAPQFSVRTYVEQARDLVQGRERNEPMARILLVDDNADFVSILSLVLTNAGYEVRLASGGQQALDLYRTHPTDLVVIDLVMPGKEGVEVIMELRRDYPDAKIIAISGAGGDGLQSNLKMAKALGAQLVLTKPFSDEEILAAVNELLEGE